MKVIKRALMVLVIVSAFMLTYSISNKITKDTNTNLYNHFNPVVDGEELVNNSDELTFDAFFLEDKDNDGFAEKYRGTTIENKKSEVLYVNVTTNGESTLQNATLTFDTKNATVNGVIPRNSLFETSINSSNFGTLDIKEVNDSINTLFTVNVTASIDKDLANYNANNKVIIKGELVSHSTGEVTNFEKEVTYTVNSFSKRASTRFGTNKSSYTENTYQVNYEINVEETNNASPLYQTIIEGSVTKLLGQDPINVTAYPDGLDNYTFTYDPSTLTFRAEKKAVIENGNITKAAYNTISYGIRNTRWHVSVIYPALEETNGETVGLTATAWHTAIKNKDIETFETSKVTTILTQELTKFVEVNPGFVDKSTYNFGELVDDNGTYFVDKTPIVNAYRGETPENILYNEKWHLESYLAKGYKASALYENTGSYVGNRIFIDNYITYNKINITPCNSYSYDNRSFKLIDADTGKVIMIIKNTDFGKYINLPEGIHKIKLQTEVLDESSIVCFNAYMTKEINTSGIINNFSENEFDYSNIASNMNASEVFEDGTINQPSLSHRNTASFSEKSSYVRLSTDKVTYEREVSDYRVPVELSLSTNPVYKANLNKWGTGIFVVEMPSFIIDVENINISSNSEIIGKEHYVRGNNQYLKIIFKANNNETTAVVKFDAIVDPVMPSTTADFKLYGYNSNSTLYINPIEDTIDIDSDGNTSELIAYTTHAMNLSVPNEVITGSTITDFSSDNSIVVSPLTADINPLRGSDEVTIDVFILNNAKNDISNLSILGRTGFVGNKYVVGSGSLGTEYNTFMKTGITVPQELSSIVTIYYSTNENATKDLSDSSNGWTLTPSDYNNVKSFLIKFNDEYILEKGARQDFTYKVKLPTNTEFLNKVSYVIHGAYFNYITPVGVLPSQISASKLGLRISRKYNADINLYKKYSNIPLWGAIFSLTSDDGEEIPVLIDNSGHAHVEGLRVGKNYTLTQKTAAYNSIVNNESASFTINNGSNDELSLTKSGNYKNITFNGTDTVTIDIENEVYYQLEIHSNDISDDSPIANAVYRITGPNHESGSTVVTNESGWIRLQGLLVNETYTVSQVYVNGYSNNKAIELKIVRDKDNHELYLTTRQKPTIELSQNCSDKFLYNNDSSNPYAPMIYTDKETNNTAGTFVCDINLDLTKYNSDYKITGTISANDQWGESDESSVELYLTKGSDTTGLPAFATLSNEYNYTGNFSIGKSFDNDNVTYKNNLIPSVDDFKGGEEYNFKIVYNRSSYNSSTTSLNPSMRIENLEINSKDGKLELVQNDTKVNLPSSDNANVIQSVFDNGPVPTVLLNIGNKAVEKKTFELVSADSTNGDPVPYAQFIIKGPGLPDDGKILTADENGIADIDLYLSFSGYYQNVPGIAGNPDYPLSNEYTIEQVYAPSGYTTNTKQIKFKINADYPTLSSEPDYSFVYSNKNKFDDEEVTVTPVFKGTINSFPLFRIFKKDAENNNPLADTYYAIYKYDAETGTLSKALDQYGDVVGDELIIDGTTYHVVKTDENGEIVLPLVSGQYKLIEILSSDDKYEIDNQEYLFSVGEGIPYQPAGGDITSASMLSTAVGGGKTPTVIPTEDNGYVVLTTNSSGKPFLVKYDENDQVIWSTSISQKYRMFNDTAYMYFDKPGELFYEGSTPSEINDVYNLMLTEEDSGYYVYLNQNSLVKINKDTGDVIYDLYDRSKPTFIIKMNGICDMSDATYTPYSYQLIDGDNDHYYCDITTKYYNHTNAIAAIAFDSNNHGFIQLKDSNTYWGLRNDKTGEEFNTLGLGIIKYDNDGYVVDVIRVDDKLTQGLNDFIESQGLDTSTQYSITSFSDMYTQVKYLEDDSVVILTYISISGLGQQTIAAKFDGNGDLVYFTPVGFNGKKMQPTSDQYARLMNIYDDGSFTMFSNMPPLSIGSDSLYLGEDFHKDFEPEAYNPSQSGMMVEFDKNGKLSNVFEINRYSRNISLYDTSNDYHRVNNVNNMTFAEKDGDGYIIGAPYQWAYGDNTVILSSGEVVDLLPESNTFILYEINKDSEVEWIRQYRNDNGLSQRSPYIQMKNNTIYVPFVSSQKSLVNVHTNEIINAKNQNGSSYTLIAKIDINSEEKAAIPTRINLDLLNNRKVFSVSINTNNGGTFNITKDNNVIYNGPTPDVEEHVKYGDNSLNEIVITPDSGYVVESIKINDDNAPFIVNPDGTIKLDQINDVKENKVIYVTFKQAESKVIVHHYLDGTSTRVASDVIITGNVNDKYITVPTLTRNYTLITDSEGNLIMPNNYQGKFTVEPIEVTYYYKEADAQLIVNFFLNNTDIQLAPSTEEEKPLGSSYQTSPLQINRYRLFGVNGDENGILNKSLTEVSYFYDPLTQTKVTTRYLDEDTGEKVAEDDVTSYDNGTTYVTYPLQTLPLHYAYSYVDGNVSGQATGTDVVVTYYYSKVKGKVVTRYVSKDNQIDLLPPNVQYVKYDDTYYAKEPTITPDGYKLYSKPTQLSGIVDKDEIYLLYIYEKVEEPVIPSGDTDPEPITPSDKREEKENISPSIPEIDINEKEIVNPKTSDNIGKYFILLIISTTLFVATIVIDKKRSKRLS